MIIRSPKRLRFLRPTAEGFALGGVGLAMICAAPAAAQTVEPPTICTLHVAGAKSRPIKASAFIRVAEPPAAADDPGKAAFQYNPVTRAAALSDAELRTLFPANAQVAIVRHPQGITKDALKAARTSIFPREAGCHAELIVSDVVPVFPPRTNPYGLVGAALAGGNRLDIVFTFRRFEEGAARPLQLSEREHAPLTPPDPAASVTVLAEAVSTATSKAFADFVELLTRRGSSSPR